MPIKSTMTRIVMTFALLLALLMSAGPAKADPLYLVTSLTGPVSTTPFMVDQEVRFNFSFTSLAAILNPAGAYTNRLDVAIGSGSTWNPLQSLLFTNSGQDSARIDTAGFLGQTLSLRFTAVDLGSFTVPIVTVANVTPVPLPGAVWLLLSSLLGLVGLRSRLFRC